MDFYRNFLSDMAQTPEESYRGMTQATINDQWINTTQLRLIKEENYPFDNTYTEYEALVNTISEFTTNTSKVSGDYVRFMFKDIDHPLNHRGQKYKYAPDGESENYYLCYEKLNPLTQVPDFKGIRCNNHLTLLGTDGQIIKEPCTIGYEIMATNNGVTKDATISQRRMVLLVQGNSNTNNIKLNQRFIFQHKQAYKITEMNVLNQEDYNEENVTLFTFYIEWSSILPTDNLELNIADYYQSNYILKINSSNLSLSNGATGQLTSTVTLNDNEVTVPLVWSTSDSSVVKIDSQGNYQVVGSDGSMASITCSIDGHSEVYDTISLSVVATPVVVKELIVNPTIFSRLLQGNYVDISYGVYSNGVKLSDVVTIVPSGANASCYTLDYTANGIRVTNKLKSTTPLTLTFTSGSLSQVISIPLGGLI